MRITVPFVGLAIAASLVDATPSRSPHIFMMLVDDWGSYDASWRIKDLGRTPDIATPNIDALSGTGIRFANYYVQPICSPTRAVLMAGRYSIHTGAEHILFGATEPSCLPVALPLMPQAFKRLGYSTHMLGKWHLGYPNSTCAPWGRGFDSYLGYLNGVGGYRAHGMGPYEDFHECTNNTDRGPYTAAATTATATATGDGIDGGFGGDAAGASTLFTERSGALVAGNAASGVKGGAEQNVTLTEAEALCAAAADCWGFTFNGSTAAAVPDDGVTIHRVLFKHTMLVEDDPGWTSFTRSNMPAPKTCDQCTYRYEGEYSAMVYTSAAQRIISKWTRDDPPLFMYLAWQSVHEPMDAPAAYLEQFSSITDPSRRIYAGMLKVLDEGIGNITATLRATPGMYANSVIVVSNDNGGMSGSYGLGCCNCGTSCGGLNYPYRGWKDSFWEGGFRGNGFLHSPLVKDAGYTYAPLLHVSDWYKTLVSAAMSTMAPADRTAAEAKLGPLLTAGPTDSVDQWDALANHAGRWAATSPDGIGSVSGTGPRTEILLAGIDVDKQGATIRVGDYKLLVGNWGADTWCDLNVSGLSPVYPAEPASNPLIGGEGGLVCVHLNASSATATEVADAGKHSKPPPKPPWWSKVTGLYDVVADPRELHDLQATHPDVVQKLMARLLFWNATTVPTIHAKSDPAGTQHANDTSCWSPWQDSPDVQ